MGLMAKPGQFDFRFPDVLIDTGLIIDIPRGKDTRDSQLEGGQRQGRQHGGGEHDGAVVEERLLC